MKLTIAGAIRCAIVVGGFTAPAPALADMPCQNIAIVWRYAKLSMRDGRPIVQNQFGTYALNHDDDVDWTKITVATALPPNDVVGFAYFYDQWTPAQKAVLEFPGGPKIEIKGISEQVPDNPQLWHQTDRFEIGNGTITKTIQLEGIREFGHAYKHPSNPNVVYLLPQDSSSEDNPCGPRDGPGLVEIDVKTLAARMLFKTPPFTPNAGIWSVQISGNKAWMLTSTGVCRGDFQTEERVCWGFWKGIVSDSSKAHPFIGASRVKDNRAIAMTIPGVIRILGGRKWGFDDQFFFEIKPSEFYKDKHVYLDKSEIQPVLTRDESRRR